jgi:hypothetical protein
MARMYAPIGTAQRAWREPARLLDAARGVMRGPEPTPFGGGRARRRRLLRRARAAPARTPSAARPARAAPSSPTTGMTSPWTPTRWPTLATSSRGATHLPYAQPRFGTPVRPAGSANVLGGFDVRRTGEATSPCQAGAVGAAEAAKQPTRVAKDPRPDQAADRGCRRASCPPGGRSGPGVAAVPADSSVLQAVTRRAGRDPGGP